MNRELLRCPLCSSHRKICVKRYRLADLRQTWVASFGFDPFSSHLDSCEELRQFQCCICRIEFFDPLIVGDSKFYEKLSRNSWYYQADQWEFFEAIDRLLKQKTVSTVCEVGCGKGHFLDKLADSYEVFGTELNVLAVDECVSKGLNVVNAEQIPSDRVFDAVVAFEVLEHVPSPHNFLQNLVNATAPGGTLILAVPNPVSWLKDLDCCLLDMPPHHCTRWHGETFAYLSDLFSIDLVSFSYEPITFLHYQSCFSYHEQKIKVTPFSGSRFPLLRRGLEKLLSPVVGQLKELEQLIMRRTMIASFLANRESLVGQTQLVEFRKR